MGLVAAKCPACGAAIQIPEESDRCFCTYCGTQVLTEAAINFARVQVDGVVQAKAADFDVQAGVLLAYHGESTDVVIPETVNTISQNALRNLPLTSVTLPRSIKSVRFDDFRAIRTLEVLHYAAEGTDWFEAGDVLYSASQRALLFYPPAKRDAEYVVGGGTRSVAIYNNPYLRRLVIEPGDVENCPDIVIDNCKNLAEIVFPFSGVKTLKLVSCPAIERLDLPAFVMEAHIGNCSSLSTINCPSALDKLSISGCPLERFNDNEGVVVPEGTADVDLSISGMKRLFVGKGIRKLHVNCSELAHFELGEGVERLERFEVIGTSDMHVKLPASLVYVNGNAFNSYNLHFEFPNVDGAEIIDGPLKAFRSNYWRNQGRCSWCGGKLKGFRTKRCRDCGKEA